jgi:preprotein translocase subunit SecG
MIQYQADMKNTLVIAETIISIALTALILLQAKGVGLGRSLGSTAYHSRRGMERIVFRVTIILAILFATLAIISQLIIS